MAEELKMKSREDSPEINSENAMSSATGNMAYWFLKDNKNKGRPLEIPSLGIRLKPDGSVEKLPKQK
jgi:hypothetical protein